MLYLIGTSCIARHSHIYSYVSSLVRGRQQWIARAHAHQDGVTTCVLCFTLSRILHQNTWYGAQRERASSESLEVGAPASTAQTTESRSCFSFTRANENRLRAYRQPQSTLNRHQLCRSRWPRRPERSRTLRVEATRHLAEHVHYYLSPVTIPFCVAPPCVHSDPGGRRIITLL